MRKNFKNLLALAMCAPLGLCAALKPEYVGRGSDSVTFVPGTELQIGQNFCVIQTSDIKQSANGRETYIGKEIELNKETFFILCRKNGIGFAVKIGQGERDKFNDREVYLLSTVQEIETDKVQIALTLNCKIIEADQEKSEPSLLKRINDFVGNPRLKINLSEKSITINGLRALQPLSIELLQSAQQILADVKSLQQSANKYDFLGREIPKTAEEKLQAIQALSNKKGQIIQLFKKIERFNDASEQLFTSFSNLVSNNSSDQINALAGIFSEMSGESTRIEAGIAKAKEFKYQAEQIIDEEIAKIGENFVQQEQTIQNLLNQNQTLADESAELRAQIEGDEVAKQMRDGATTGAIKFDAATQTEKRSFYPAETIKITTQAAEVEYEIVD